MKKSGSIYISGCLSRSRQQCGRGQKFRVRFARDYLVYDPPYLMSWIRPCYASHLHQSEDKATAQQKIYLLANLYYASCACEHTSSPMKHTKASSFFLFFPI